MNEQHLDVEFITPMTIPAFQYDDEETTPVCKLEIGDKFQAMYTGEHELVGFGSGMVQARHLKSGKVFDFGPFAPVKRVN